MFRVETDMLQSLSYHTRLGRLLCLTVTLCMTGGLPYEVHLLRNRQGWICEEFKSS